MAVSDYAPLRTAGTASGPPRDVGRATYPFTRSQPHGIALGTISLHSCCQTGPPLWNLFPSGGPARSRSPPPGKHRTGWGRAPLRSRAPTAFVPARYWHVSPCNRVATTRKRTQELKPAATRTLPRPTAEPADRAGIAPTGRRYRPLTSSPRGAADVLSQCHGGAVALIDFYRSGRAYTGIPRRFPVRRRWHRSAFQVAFFHTLIN